MLTPIVLTCVNVPFYFHLAREALIEREVLR